MATKGQRVVGIDFGTSTTLVAERNGAGHTSVLPIGETTPWLPSVVGIDEDGQLCVGERAQRLPLERSVSSVKSRLTERTHEVETQAGTIAVADAIAAILSEVIARAESVQPGMFDDAEIYLGCPALWTGDERKLLVDIAASLGLDVDVGQVIDEPVAAGLSWLQERWMTSGRRPNGKAVVFDAGGGTLDVAYLNVVGTEQPEMTVLSAEGVAESGDLLDQSIARDLLSQLSDSADDPFIERLLSERARELKEALSFELSRQVALGGNTDTILRYERDQLEAVFDPQLARAMRLVESAVRGSLLRLLQPLDPARIRAEPWAGLAHDVGHVALVGGLSLVPAVRTRIQQLLPAAEIDSVTAPQESVVRGLANGDQLAQLNLPRPPIDFCVAFEGLARQPSDSWLAENRVVYRAFTPLYSRQQLALGESPLSFSADIPIPPGNHNEFTISITCEVPDRRRTPLRISFYDPENDSISVDDAIRLRHQGSRRARLNLYSSGDIVVSSSHQSHRARIATWPRIRGRFHDWDAEIKLEKPGLMKASATYDNWRYK